MYFDDDEFILKSIVDNSRKGKIAKSRQNKELKRKKTVKNEDHAKTILESILDDDEDDDELANNGQMCAIAIKFPIERLDEMAEKIKIQLSLTLTQTNLIVKAPFQKN